MTEAQMKGDIRHEDLIQKVKTMSDFNNNKVAEIAIKTTHNCNEDDSMARINNFMGG